LTISSCLFSSLFIVASTDISHHLRLQRRLAMMLLSALLIALAPPILGFSFNVETDSVSECGFMNLTWSGGTPPFTLTVIVRSLCH
jgi:hypothetical protein